MEKPRISRLSQIVTILQSKRLITARELAEKFNVSIRTIYRDIRTLESSGIPIVTEEGKGYFLQEGYQLPPIMFSEEEANHFSRLPYLLLYCVRNRLAVIAARFADDTFRNKQGAI